MIHKIIAEINKSINAEVFNKELLSRSKVYGLAEIVQYDDGKCIPAAYNLGELSYCGLDDIYPVILYHKIYQARNPLNYDIRYTSRDYDMAMVVAVNDCTKVDYTALELAIITSLQNITVSNITLLNTDGNSLKLHRCAIGTGASTDFNSLALLNTDYKAQNIFKPELRIFTIRYSVSIAFSGGCVEILCC